MCAGLFETIGSRVPRLLRHSHARYDPGGNTARVAAVLLTGLPAAIAVTRYVGWPRAGPDAGVVTLGAVFAVNSAVHSHEVRQAD